MGFGNRGFTFLELLIVLAATAILAAILLPNYRRARAEDQLKGCKSNVKNLATALEIYSTDNAGHYPKPANFGLLVPNYIQAVPQCPSAESDTYSGQYTSNTVPDAYSIRCGGSYPEAAGLRANEPQYSSYSGILLP